MLSLSLCAGLTAAPGSPQAAAALTAALRPRYHFAASSTQFFQRQPYRNEPSITGAAAALVADGWREGEAPLVGARADWHPARFLALCRVDAAAPKDRKWLHALSLAPLAGVRGLCGAIPRPAAAS